MRHTACLLVTLAACRKAPLPPDATSAPTASTASTASTTSVIDAGTTKTAASAATNEGVYRNDSAIQFDHAGRTIRVFSPHGVDVLDAATGKVLGAYASDVGLEPLAPEDGDRHIRAIGSDGVHLLDPTTGALVEKHPLAEGHAVLAQGKDVLLVQEGDVISLVDIPSGKTSKLPGSWWPKKSDDGEPETSMSFKGDRIAIIDPWTISGQRIVMTGKVYDTNKRTLLNSVRYTTGVPAGGAFGGRITPDGKAISWSYSRGSEATEQDIEGGARRTVADPRARSPLYTVELPNDTWGGEEDSKKHPRILRVRNAAGAQVGKLDVPTSGDDLGPYSWVVAFCGDAPRAVVAFGDSLYVVHLPDGKRLSTHPLGAGNTIAGDSTAEPRTIACAADGKHVAALVKAGENADEARLVRFTLE